jgi:hypothetical protein
MFEQSFDRRTLTGTTANVYANKPFEDLDYEISAFEMTLFQIFDKRTLTGTTANVYANKPFEDLDYEISAFEEFEEDWYLTSPYEFESEYAKWEQSLKDRIERDDAVRQRKNYDIWISKFRKLKQVCGRMFCNLLLRRK